MESSKSIEDFLSNLMDENSTIKENGIQDYQLSDEYINKWNVISFTDGSCIGKRGGCKFGGSGIYFYSTKNENYNGFKAFKKYVGDTLLYMSLDNKIVEYCSTDCSQNICDVDDCTKISYTNDTKCSKHKNDTSRISAKYFTYSPTNIRAEGFAILMALQCNLLFLTTDSTKSSAVKSFIKLQEQNIINADLTNLNNDIFNNVLYKNGVSISELEPNAKSILIVSDSKFWIDLITKWLSNWISKRTLLERKNLDIIVMIYNVLALYCENNIKLLFQHVEGHKDKKEREENLNIYYKGNILSDKLATHASKSENKEFVILK
jgi:ribonuclease HI